MLKLVSPIDARAPRGRAQQRSSDWSESRARSPRWLCAARTVTSTSEQASLAVGLVLSRLVQSRCSCVNSRSPATTGRCYSGAGSKCDLDDAVLDRVHLASRMAHGIYRMLASDFDGFWRHDTKVSVLALVVRKEGAWPASLALKHTGRPGRMEDCLGHPHKPLAWLITPGQLEQRLTVPEMTLRVTTVIRCSGACEAPPADRAATDQMGAAGQRLHLSFGSSGTSKLGLVVVAWDGLWTCSYFTK